MTERRAGRLTTAEYERNFAEIHPALNADEAFAEASRCLYCFDAPCTRACPTHIDVPSFIKKIASGNLRGSARVILDANPMGHSCARGCPTEVLCEGACVMNALQKKPIPIGQLQRVATDHVLSRGIQLFSAGEANGKSVGIVGSGPAGLSAAQDLRRWGFAVTLYEQKDRVGGLNTDGIAQYKLRPDTALAEAQSVLDLGVTVKLNVTVGQSLAWDTLLAAHDAIIVAAGLGDTNRLGIPGEDQPGVLDSLHFIADVKLRPYAETPVGRTVCVIGAGNTAVDASTQAHRLGAQKVMLIIRRGPADISAYDHEVALAKHDEVELRTHTRPIAVLGDGDGVTGLQCVSTAMGADGKLQDVPGSEHVIACDMVIKAIGQQKRGTWLSAIPGVAVAGGLPVFDPVSGQSLGNPKVFVAGDLANGGAEIVNAAAEGKRAAAGIAAHLGGK